MHSVSFLLIMLELFSFLMCLNNWTHQLMLKKNIQNVKLCFVEKISKTFPEEVRQCVPEKILKKTVTPTVRSAFLCSVSLY